ncbi:MAG: site-specific integrase [Oscillospiraceae bacterium]|jgi:integrase|nr:site-specific integrase [Oscillospiraceae bacterium]
MPTKKAHRRGNKEGSIFKRNDGRWSGAVFLGYNELGKPIRKYYYGATRQEVAEKISGAVHQVLTGTMPAKSRAVSLQQLIDEYLWTFKKPSVSDVTFEWYLNMARTHISPALGELRLTDVTAAHIQNLINAMHAAGLSCKLVKETRGLLNQVFIHALDVDAVTKNPVSKTKLPKASRLKAEQKEDAKVIPVTDRARILAAAEGDLRMKTALTVLMFTGMRIGEFLALTWGNVDFKNGVITIDRAITHTCAYNSEGQLSGRQTVVGITKTQCSTRNIKAASAVMTVLRVWRTYLPNHFRREPENNPTAPNATVFPNDLGQMRSYNGFRTTYRRFMSEQGLPNYPLHSYRHTFATMLLEAGTNPKIVQKLLGHRDIETTLGIYSHVLPEVFDGAADTLAKVYKDMTA